MEPEPEERKGTQKGQTIQETDNGTVNSEGLNQSDYQSSRLSNLGELSYQQSVPEIDESNIMSQRQSVASISSVEQEENIELEWRQRNKNIKDWNENINLNNYNSIEKKPPTQDKLFIEIEKLDSKR